MNHIRCSSYPLEHAHHFTISGCHVVDILLVYEGKERGGGKEENGEGRESEEWRGRGRNGEGKRRMEREGRVRNGEGKRRMERERGEWRGKGE